MSEPPEGNDGPDQRPSSAPLPLVPAEPTDPLDRYEGAGTTELQRDQAGKEVSDDTVKAALRQQEVEQGAQQLEQGSRRLELMTKLVDKAEQANRLRGRFFLWVACLVSAVILASIGVMAAYMYATRGAADPVVLVSFFASVVVTVIGLAHLVGKYLFAPSEAETAVDVIPQASAK